LILPLPFAHFFLVDFFGAFQARPDALDDMIRCLDAARRLLLEGIEHVDRRFEFDGVHGAIGVTIVVCSDFQNLCAAKAGPRLGAFRVFAELNKT